MYYTCHYNSPVGELTLASNGISLTGLWIQGQKHFAAKHYSPVLRPDLPVFAEVTAWLDQYFAGNSLPPGSLPLKLMGTPFQMRVWELLLTIPWGQTVTYGHIARELDHANACQAVGSAIGHNPISIIIPCHRVVGSNGNLTGYAGGIERKIWLLNHEGILK